MTRSHNSGRLLTSHLRVLSLRSGLNVPQSKYRWTSNSTSLRSPFWLTDRLGLTSQPTLSVGLGEIETVKHPSPSMYPEIYDPRSTSPYREPASCSSRRFVMLRLYVWAVTVTGASPQGISRYGAIPSLGRQRASHGIALRLSPRPWSRQPGWVSPLCAGLTRGITSTRG